MNYRWLGYDFQGGPEKIIKIKPTKQDKRNKLIAKKLEKFLNYYYSQPEVRKRLVQDLMDRIFNRP